MENNRSSKRGSDEFDGMLSPGMKRMRSSDKFEVRLLIPSKAAGSIIGKGGSKIQQLRSENNSNVRVPDSPGPERVMTIQSEDSATAIKVIEQALPFMSEENDGPPDLRILLHDSVVGGVIGRAGAKIQEIRSQSGANIRVYKTCCPQSTERCIALEGDDEKIIAALEIILEVIKSNDIRGADILFDPSNFDGIYAAEYGGYGNETDVIGFSRGDVPLRNVLKGRARGNSGSRGFGGPNNVNFTPRGSGEFSRGMGNVGFNRFEESALAGFGNYGDTKSMISPGLGMNGYALGLNGGGLGLNASGFDINGGLSMNGGGLGMNDRGIAMNANRLGINSGGLGLIGGGLGLNGSGLGLNGSGLGLNGGPLAMNGSGLGLNGGQLAMNGSGLGLNCGFDMASPRNQNDMSLNPDAMRGMMKTGSNGAMDSGPTPIETKVTIPNAMAGAIIGTRGSRIKQIRLESKAKIDIGDPDDTTNERIITISGNEKTIQLAQFLLQQAVREDGLNASNF